MDLVEAPLASSLRNAFSIVAGGASKTPPPVRQGKCVKKRDQWNERRRQRRSKAKAG
jgi:hypothetical protein